MNDASIESLHERVSVADEKLGHLRALLRTKSWQTYEAEGDHLVRGEHELENEISKTHTELINLRSSLRVVEMRTVTVPTA